jgi:hypothetical protein
MFTTPAIDPVPLAKTIGHAGSFAAYRSRVRGLPAFGGELPAVTMSEEIETPGDGQIRAMITAAGNPVLSIPNGRRLEKALDQLEFMVSIDPYLNETTRHADVILPAHRAAGALALRARADPRLGPQLGEVQPGGGSRAGGPAARLGDLPGAERPACRAGHPAGAAARVLPGTEVGIACVKASGWIGRRVRRTPTRP